MARRRRLGPRTSPNGRMRVCSSSLKLVQTSISRWMAWSPRCALAARYVALIAQTLVPKKGGGRVAALEVLIITPAISNLIREGKTFQIPSAMQTGKNHGMVMLNDALFELVKNGVVEARDAYVKAVDKTGFETMLTRAGMKI